MELSNRHGVTSTDGGNRTETVSLPQDIRSGVTSTLSTATVELSITRDGFLITKGLGRFTERWEAHNVINNADNLSDFLWQVVWLGDSVYNYVAMSNRAERSELGVEDSVGSLHWHGDSDGITQSRKLVVLDTVVIQEVSNSLDTFNRWRELSLDFFFLIRNIFVSKELKTIIAEKRLIVEIT